MQRFSSNGPALSNKQDRGSHIVGSVGQSAVKHLEKHQETSLLVFIFCVFRVLPLMSKWFS